jgi:hypothetical protein
MIEGWHSNLVSDEVYMDYLLERGIHTKTVVEHKIGYDRDKHVYTIPVFGPDGEIWNVRRYTTRENARTKIWSVEGMRTTELYPISILLDSDEVVFAEGEWDCLITLQHGFRCITKTTSATHWNNAWNELFRDKVIYFAGDRDKDGQIGVRKAARALHRIADVRLIDLPYEIMPKHGKDLTDFWLEHDRADFEQLMANARRWKVKDESEREVITVLDSFDSQRVGKEVNLQVTIKGKKDPGYSVPHKIAMTCTRDRGPMCQYCPLNAKDGEAEYLIEPNDPTVLAMMEATQLQLMAAIATSYGVPGGKCPKLEMEIIGHQAVEILFARPSIDHSDGTQAKDYKNIKITSVGRHDTMPNNTVIVTGALYPNPKDQHNEFLAWEIERQETSVDRFQMSDEAVRLMKRFQPRKGQPPLKKLGSINRELAAHVTRIVGRPEMHAVMDLTFHSALAFKFGGQLVHRGWIESLIVGDTRTGKSEAAERLVRHFGAGEVVGGEAATLAGLVGGMQQIGGKDWAVTWGVIPINDRRIVVIDELSGLHPDEISKMSDVRSSGMAKLTKVLQEVTYARTRLLWLGNPRMGGMDQFTYGVDSIRPLIGNPEDIARFDLAMAVAKGDVPPDLYNKPIETGELKLTSEACHTLLMWVWTRTADQIVFAKGAEDVVYKLAMDLGSRYVEDPPLVQAANARIKIARVAVAIAARTFSADDSYEKVVVTKDHVRDAVKFIDMIYAMPAFGYAERSEERLRDIAEAIENKDDTRRFLLERRGLAKFLRSNGRFRRQDLEEILSVDRDVASAIISKLWDARMIRKEGPDNRVEPTLHELLREGTW